MPTKTKRVIIDTNLWISFLISKNFTNIDNILFSNQCTLIFSNELLEEFLEVSKRPKFKQYIFHSDLERLLETIDEHAIFVKVKSQLDLCRDTKDNFLLALAVDSKADFLLTGDKDLLEITKIKKTKIVTISTFLNLFKY